MSGEGLAKLQGLAASTAASIRSTSFKTGEKLNQGGEFSQKVAASVVSTGVPSLAQQLQEFVAQLWKKLVLFLESKGLKEPLERNYEKFKGLPIVQYLLKLFADLLKVLFKSQFVKKVMGGKSQQVVEEEKQEEAEVVPVNGMKVQEAPFTVMEALQKKVIEGAPSSTTENTSPNAALPENKISLAEAVANTQIEKPTASTKTEPIEKNLLEPEKTIPEKSFPEAEQAPEAAPPTPAMNGKVEEETGSPGPPVDEEAVTKSDHTAAVGEMRTELVRGSSWRAP